MDRMIDAHIHLSKAGISESFDSELIGHIDETLAAMVKQQIVMGIVAHGLPSATLDQVVTRYASAFKGLLHVRGWEVEKSLEEIEQYGENPNIVGIKIYPNSFEGSDFRRALRLICERIATKRWIIQVHSNPVVAADLGVPLETVLFARETDLPVVMVHTGGTQFLQLAGWLQHGVPDNLYFETSGIQNMFCDSPLRSQVKWLLDLVPQERLLWGSDYPDYAFSDALRAFAQLDFTDEDMMRIAWQNPMKLLRDHTDTELPSAKSVGERH